MKTYDFTSGEPMDSPDILGSSTTDMNTRVEYVYDPNHRFQEAQSQGAIVAPPVYNQPQMQYNPYNQPNPNFNANMAYPMYQQQVKPYNQYYYNGSNPYNQYNNGFQQQWSGYQGAPYAAQPNPAIYGNSYNSGYGYQQPLQMQLNYEDKIVSVPGFNSSGSDVLLSKDAEETCNRWQMDMLMEQQEAIEKRNNRFQGYFNNNYWSYNYYGNPYVMDYTDQSVTEKYRQKVMSLREEAVEKRKNLNKNLSRLCHNYLGDQVTEEQINQTYDGYTYTIPGSELRGQAEQERFARFVPASNQQMYAQHNAEVSARFNMLVRSNANMNEFLHDAGYLIENYKLEEEMHRRRDASLNYQGDTYKMCLRRSIKERLDREGRQANAQEDRVLRKDTKYILL